MASNPFRLAGLLVATAAAAYGCGDTTSPVASATHGGRAPSLAGSATSVAVLQRNTPLTKNVSVTVPIGKNGGTIEIPEAGIKVIFPKNALTPPKANHRYDITVTALKGDEVAYTFEPHGLTFREPVMVMQDYKDTHAYKNPGVLSAIEGAYFPALSDLDAAGATARVSEFRPTDVDVTGSKIKFTVEHFSGYLIASGRSNR